MGIWAKLFGSDSVIDAGIKGIDSIVFTDEEKSNARMMFLKLYEPYKIAQRLLMTFVCIPYVTLWLITGLILVADVFTARPLSTDKLTGFLTGSDVGSAFVIVVVFYFGGGAVEGVVNRFKEKAK